MLHRASRSSSRDCLQKSDLGGFRDRDAPIPEPGWLTTHEAQDMFTEDACFVEEVDTQVRVAFQQTIDSLAYRIGFELDPPHRADRRLEKPRQDDGHPCHQIAARVRILGKENGS